MHIVILSDDYLPDSTRVHAKMLHELGEEFLALGHSVVVVTPGNIQQSKKLEVSNIDGVEIWRFRTRPTRHPSKIHRTINETLLSLNSWLAIKDKVKERHFDLIINYSPTIFYGPLVNKLKKLGPSKSYLVLRDLFPQWAIDEGLIRPKSLVEKYFRFFEHLNYKSSDFIGLMSQANIDLFQEINPQYPNIGILNNWSKLTQESFQGDVKELSDLDLKDKTVFFYGGNIGRAQNIDNLVNLARGIKDQAAHFIFLGQGDEVELLKNRITEFELSNVTYIPSVSQEIYLRILSKIDIGLFSLAKSHTAHNFPGKLLGYMSLSKPILGSVNPKNDVLDCINKNQAGFCHINGEDEALQKSAIQLIQDSQLRKTFGKNSRKLLETQFSVQSAAQKIIETLT